MRKYAEDVENADHILLNRGLGRTINQCHAFGTHLLPTVRGAARPSRLGRPFRLHRPSRLQATNARFLGLFYHMGGKLRMEIKIKIMGWKLLFVSCGS